MKLFLGILLLLMSIFLVIAVLMQNGKSKRLSGTIAGGAETFFGKTKSRTIDAVLSKLTTVVAILFVLVVIIVYVAFGTSNDYLTQEELNEMIENGEIQIVTDDNLAAEESETPAEESETPAEESETPAEESETPVEESKTPVEETEAPAEEAEAPAEAE